MVGLNSDLHIGKEALYYSKVNGNKNNSDQGPGNRVENHRRQKKITET